MNEHDSDDFDIFGDDEAGERPRRKRMSTRKKVIAFILVPIFVLAGIVVGGALIFQHRIDSLIERFENPFKSLPDRPTVPKEIVEAEGDKPVNILILGSDSQISAGDPSQWSAGAQRTDAIMIAHLDADREAASVMSIPRDTWVDIPGRGQHKINAAYSFGGPALMVQTVEQLTGIRIDHVVIADFESFAAVTDALGGVNITLRSPLVVGGQTIQPGNQRLTGDQALRYVRERKNLAGGDFSRVQRQQNWIRSIMREVFDKNILTDFGSLTNFVETVAASIAVDEEFTIGQMRDLLYSARNLRPGGVHFFTMPHLGSARSSDGQSIVLLDDEKAPEVFNAIAHDEITTYLSENPDVGARLPAQPE